MTEQETPIQMVYRVCGDMPEEQANSLLWATSCFPFGTPEQIEKSLRESWEAGGKTFEGSMDYSEKKLDEAMAEMKEYMKEHPEF